MVRRVIFFAIVSAFALGGVGCQKADDVVVVVTTSYPGVKATVVAEVIAAPIEQQVNGVEGLVRMESQCGNDGQYICYLHFRPRTDPTMAATLVKNRVALAMPLLPDAARMAGVKVEAGKAPVDPNQVVIAVLDRQDLPWHAREKYAVAVAKRLATENAMVQPSFPQGELRVSVHVNRKKCAALGVPMAEVNKSIETAGPAATIDDLNKVIVRDQVPLREIAALEEVAGPAEVWRINLYPAIRISGAPPDDQSAAEAAARCVELAETVLPREFVVENLSANPNYPIARRVPSGRSLLDDASHGLRSAGVSSPGFMSLIMIAIAFAVLLATRGTRIYPYVWTLSLLAAAALCIWFLCWIANLPGYADGERGSSPGGGMSFPLVGMLLVGLLSHTLWAAYFCSIGFTLIPPKSMPRAVRWGVTAIMCMVMALTLTLTVSAAAKRNRDFDKLRNRPVSSIQATSDGPRLACSSARSGCRHDCSTSAT